MNELTLEKMKQMRLFGMHNAFTNAIGNALNEHYTNDEFASMLITAEWDDKNNRKVERMVKGAKFKYKANIEDISYDENRNIDKNQILRLAECNFIKNNENILITGSTGVGKSYLATALGYQSCTEGYRTMYFNTNKLFAKLKIAKADGSYLKELAKIERQHLIIIDDFGLQLLDAQNRIALLEIIEDRHSKGSIIVTSQIPVRKWYDVIGEKTIADAVLDRLVHNAHRIELNGESMRRKKHVK
ncbi:MAG: IS21-like element helper ATPase IstB [Bacteroidota bacterium]